MNKKIMFTVLLVVFCILLPLESVLAQSISRRRVTNYTVTVECNIPEAQLFIDGREVVKGGVMDKDNSGFPHQETLQAGNHTFKATAPGYDDFEQTINIQSNRTVNISLKPSLASITIELDDILGSAYNAKNQISITLDGTTQSGTNFKVAPGVHTITIKSGGIEIEQEFMFEPGETYKIEPVIELKMK